MSSSINPNNIDGNYPIAGQDNDSQGFRDNFTNIKQNLTFGKSEIEDLQNKVVLKSALLGGTTPDNNMSGTPLVGAQLSNTTEKINQLTASAGGLSLDYSAGLLHYTTINATSGSVTLTFASSTWPTQSLGYGKVRLWVIVSDNTYTLTFPDEVSVGLTDMPGVSGQTMTFPSTGTYVFEFSSYDGGSTVVVQELTRNRSTVTNATIIKKYSNESSATPTSRTLNMYAGGDQLVYLNMTSNLALTYSATITPGHQVDVTVKNTSGSAHYVNLVNANTNKASGNIQIADNTYGRFVFTAFTTAASGVVVSVQNS